MVRSTSRRNILRSARRCHLTEEIGARRRELYGVDTFKPIDDNFVWSYIKPTLPTTSMRLTGDDSVIHPDSDSISSTHFSEHSNSSVVEQEKLNVERILDSIVSRVANSVELEYEKAVSEIRSLTINMNFLPTQTSILEDYLCLFNKYRMDSVLTKLSGSIKKSPTLGVLHLYSSMLALPDSHDLGLVFDAIGSKPAASLPSTLLPAYITAQCFFHHPTVKGLIDMKPASTVTGVRTQPLSKKALKDLRKSLPQETQDFLHDILRAPAVDLDQSSSYRAKLVIDRARAIGDNQLVSLMERLITQESLDKFDLHFNTGANTAFKNSLFS